jgi:chromosome transmission fidelity protein 8
MVQLQVYWNPISSSAETVMLDLQGNIEYHKKTITSLANQDLGELRWNFELNCPVLFIGHHRLVGELITLKNPFAVMKQCVNSSDYEITALIRQKLVFRSRPEPIATLVTNEDPSC